MRCGVLVVGGGVCGLWTLFELLERGHDAWLVEAAGLGAGQTLASQGILHAGVKYRLPGNTADSSHAVAQVQPVWERALAGEGGPDLSGVRTLSPVAHLWSLPTMGARMAAEVASRVMRSGTKRLGAGERPGVLADAPSGVSVFESPERVVDPAGVVERLRAACRGRARQGRVASLRRMESGFVAVLDSGAEVAAGRVVLAAGEGNERLIASLGEDPTRFAQRRPLHQVVVHDAPGALFGHCLQASDKPVLTVTTGEVNGRRTWYLGGDLAETGPGRSAEEQITAAQAAVKRALGWVDVSGCAWSSFTIDRAEGRTQDGKRPDGPVVTEIASGAIAVWPTKLVLAPVAAARVAAALGDGSGAGGDGLGELPEARTGEPVW